MLSEAHHFSIHGSQFNHYAGSGTQARQNTIITYEGELNTPTAPSVFTGRDELVAEGVQKLRQDDPVHLAILGAGGMGKTALALHILKNEQVKEKFKDKIYFVPCDVCSDASKLIQTMIQAIQLSIPEGTTGYKVLQKFLASSQSSILLVLDNFETPWQSASQSEVWNVVDFILDQRKVSIILTMRAAKGPGTKQWIKLGGESGLPPLKLDKAREAFMKISNTQVEDIKTLNWLLTQLDCMPLAIVLIAQLRNSGLELNSLVQDWKKYRTEMLQNNEGKSKLTSVDISIGLSLQMLEAGNAECTKLLPVLSYLPNGLPMWQEQIEKLFPAFNISVRNSAIKLLDFALIYQESGSLKMLSPIQQSIQTKYPAKGDDLDQMGKYYVELLKDCGVNRSSSQPIIEMHIANIVKVLKVQIQNTANEAYWNACNAVFRYSKFFPETLALMDIAVEQKWGGNQSNIMRLTLKKGYMLGWLGQFEEAKKEVEKIQLTLKFNLKNYLNYHFSRKIRMSLKGQCFQMLGEISRMEHNYPEARAMFLKAKSVFEDNGFQNGAAKCLQSVGDILQMEDKYPEAREKLSEAKDVFEKKGDQLGAAQCLKSLSDILRMENKYPAAKERLLEAKSEFEKVKFQSGAAQCLKSLGDILWIEDRYLEARAEVLKAKSIFEDIEDQHGAAQCLKSLGDISRIENKYSEARNFLEGARSVFENKNIKDQLGAAQCLYSLSNILWDEDKYSEAISMLLKAKSIFETIGDQLGAAQCLHSLGDVLRTENKFPEAKALFLEAKTAFKKIGSRLGVAQCLQGLGDILWIEENYSEAKAMLQKAKSIFEDIGDQRGAAQCLKSLGDILRMENKYSEARNLLEEARSASESIKDQLGAAQCQKSLGNILQMENKYPEAREMLQKARSDFQTIGNQLGAAQCLQSLGNILQIESKYSEAREMLLEAKSVFENIGNQLSTVKCLQDLDEIPSVH